MLPAFCVPSVASRQTGAAPDTFWPLPGTTTFGLFSSATVRRLTFVFVVQIIVKKFHGGDNQSDVKKRNTVGRKGEERYGTQSESYEKMGNFRRSE